MIRNMVFHISVVLLITGCGKDEEGIENRSPNGILIEVEAPQTNGWSTEEVTGTRSGMAKTVRQKGEYGVDMEVSKKHCPAARGCPAAFFFWFFPYSLFPSFPRNFVTFLTMWDDSDKGTGQI